jgi:tetratricopeptide (TPR) repeat protein
VAVVAQRDHIGGEGVRLSLDHDALIASCTAPDEEPLSGLRPKQGLVGILARIEEPPADAPLDAPDALTRAVLGGARALAAGRPDEAAGCYYEARALCHAHGLVEQEAAMLIAFAGACGQAGAVQLAVDSYEQAINLAERADAWSLVGQAWLGLGGNRLQRQELAHAAAAFRAAAVAAREAGLVAMQIEALALAGVCFLRLARGREALVAWTEAVTIGAGVEVGARAAATLEDTGRELVKILVREELNQQADEVRRIVDAHRPGTP